MKKSGIIFAVALFAFIVNLNFLSKHKKEKINKGDFRNYINGVIVKKNQMNNFINYAHANEDPQFASFVRFWYFMINGWPDEETWVEDNCEGSECDGPPTDGLLGMVSEVNDMLASAVNQSMGYSDCSELTADSWSGTDDEGYFEVTIEEGNSTIPSNYPYAGGETHEWKIILAMGDDEESAENIASSEFSCGLNAGIFRMNMEGRIFELYFDVDDAEESVVDFYMQYDEDSERMAMNFKTLEDNQFAYWLVRAGEEDDGTFAGFRILAYGDGTSKEASAFIQFAGGEASLEELDHTSNNAGSTIFSTSADVSFCADHLCSLTVCVSGSDSTIGEICEGLDPGTTGTDGVWAEIPQSLIADGDQDITMGYAANGLSDDTSTP